MLILACLSCSSRRSEQFWIGDTLTLLLLSKSEGDVRLLGRARVASVTHDPPLDLLQGVLVGTLPVPEDPLVGRVVLHIVVVGALSIPEEAALLLAHRVVVAVAALSPPEETLKVALVVAALAPPEETLGGIEVAILSFVVALAVAEYAAAAVTQQTAALAVTHETSAAVTQQTAPAVTHETRPFVYPGLLRQLDLLAVLGIWKT